MAKRKSGPTNKGTVAKGIAAGLKTSGSKASKKSPFAVGNTKAQKKKPKEVKTQLKKIKAVAVKPLQEKSDATLKALHEQMVVKKTTPPAATPKKTPTPSKKKTAAASPAALKATRQGLNKLKVK